MGISQAWAFLNCWQRAVKWLNPMLTHLPHGHAEWKCGNYHTPEPRCFTHTHTHMQNVGKDESNIEEVSLFRPFPHWKQKPFMNIITDTNIY